MICKRKKPKKFRLALLFACTVFLIMLSATLLIFGTQFLLRQFGIDLVDEMAKVPLFAFALVSIGVGTVLAFVCSKLPLNPIRKVCEAADKIAEGDYSVRINLKGPAEFTRLAESFNHMAEELSSVEMLRTDFVNNFSHEFKTPIVSVRGFANMLKRNDLTAEERDECLDTIISESQRLAQLSTNVLNLTKIERQTILTDKKRFNVSEQIRLVIIMLSEKWQKKQLEFDFDCGEIYLDGNEEMLRQVWINLLDNAVKFSPCGSKVTIRLCRMVSAVTVRIENECEKLNEYEIGHVFDKFYRADKSRSSGGYGLGLPIARQIVKLHGGAIYAETLKDMRIEFCVELPCEA